MKQFDICRRYLYKLVRVLRTELTGWDDVRPSIRIPGRVWTLRCCSTGSLCAHMTLTSTDTRDMQAFDNCIVTTNNQPGQTNKLSTAIQTRPSLLLTVQSTKRPLAAPCTKDSICPHPRTSSRMYMNWASFEFDHCLWLSAGVALLQNPTQRHQ